MRFIKPLRKQVIGSIGEEYVSGILLASGYQILAENFHTPFGKIDMVAIKDIQLVILEVKTRTNRKFGFPEDAITQAKQNHMISSAEAYLEANPTGWVDYRIDVFAVDCPPEGKVTGHEWFENAVT